MLNTGRVDPELTGIGRNLWALLMYIAVFCSGTITVTGEQDLCNSRVQAGSLAILFSSSLNSIQAALKTMVPS
jgi:hypothetical protein